VTVDDERTCEMLVRRRGQAPPIEVVHGNRDLSETDAWKPQTAWNSVMGQRQPRRPWRQVFRPARRVGNIDDDRAAVSEERSKLVCAMYDRATAESLWHW